LSKFGEGVGKRANLEASGMSMGKPDVDCTCEIAKGSEERGSRCPPARAESRQTSAIFFYLPCSRHHEITEVRDRERSFRGTARGFLREGIMVIGHLPLALWLVMIRSVHAISRKSDTCGRARPGGTYEQKTPDQPAAPERTSEAERSLFAATRKTNTISALGLGLSSKTNIHSNPVCIPRRTRTVLDSVCRGGHNGLAYP
jgi:hypothetical protein